MSKSNGQSPNGHEANGHRRAVLYARVSTEDQAEHGYSLQSQVEACRKYAAGLGYTVAAELSDDISGGTEVQRRPAGGKVWDMVTRHEVQAVIWYTDDRLSRDIVDALITARTWLRAGAELYRVNGGRLENENAIDFVIGNWKGTGERADIRERTLRGKRLKARDGKWIGCGHLSFGYRKAGQGRDARIAIDQAEARVVRQIFEWYTGAGDEMPLSGLAIVRRLDAEGVPTPDRGRKAKGWHIAGIMGILRNRNYRGEFQAMGELLLFPDLALVDAATFRAAQKRIEINKGRGPRPSRRYLLTGHLQCVCGAALIGHYNSASRRYYECSARRSRWHATDCRQKSLRVERIDEPVWAWLLGLLSDPAAIDRGLAEMDAKAAVETDPKRARLAAVGELTGRAEGQIAQLARDLRDLEGEAGRAAIKGEIDALSKQVKGLQAEGDKLRAQLERADLSASQRAEVKDRAAIIAQRLPSATYDDKRFVFDALDVKAELRHDAAGAWLDASCGFQVRVLQLGASTHSKTAHPPQSHTTGAPSAQCFPACPHRIRQ